MSLYGELTHLIGNYGIAAVHKTLESIMEETYNYLQKHYEGHVPICTKEGRPTNFPTTVPQEETSTHENHIVYLPTEKKIKKVKKAEKETEKDTEPYVSTTEEPYMPPSYDEDNIKTMTIHNIHQYVPPHDETSQPNLLSYFDTHGHFPGATDSDNNSTTSSEKKNTFVAIDPAIRKQQQQQAEKKKRAELDAQGISAESLLTEDNMRRWVETEGRTYSYIARNYVGCPDTVVSAVAKKFGLKSKISKRRIMTIAASKKST